jgi:sugar phosphate permease
VVSKNVEIFKFIWLLNGVSMSFLWTSLIKLLSETISKEKIGKAIVTMGTTVAIGTFLVYSLSALFVATLNYKFTFYVASIILLIVSAIWIFNYNRLVIPLKEEVRTKEETNSTINKDKISSLGMLVVVLAIFAVANNLVKDGLTVWTPDILDSLYDTPSWLSILLTLCLPILAIFGTALAVNLHKKIKDFIGLSTLLYASAIILLVTVIIFIKMDAVVVTIICFALTSCLMAGVNNIITSMVPLEMKYKINSGKLAGILNGFCYLGSTLSAYGLGKIADFFGWSSVFTTLLIVLIVITIIGIIFISFKRKKCYN